MNRTECGTSFAAPVVSGIVARVLSSVYGTNLFFWPETLRAIVMASSNRNVDGSKWHFNTKIDDRDGVGLVTTQIALLTAEFKVGGWQSRSWQSTEPSFFQYEIEPNWAPGVPRRITAAIAWDASPHPQTGAIVLDADLDMALIRNSDGESVSCAGTANGERSMSLSFDNSMEFLTCEITNPSPDGKYQLVVTAAPSSWTQSSTYLGLAWTIF